MSSFLFSSAKRGKHSRSPTPASRQQHHHHQQQQQQQQQQQLASPEAATPLRSRGSGRGSADAPILPHTITMNDAAAANVTTTTTPRRRPRGGTHNNFLAGGMNVDHKLKRTRRQAKRHRHNLFSAFFYNAQHSRYHRRVVLLTLSGMVIIIFVLRQQGGGHNAQRRQLPITDPSIHLPPIEYTRALILERERLRSLNSWNTARRAVLERLAPTWFHRNNPDYSSNQVKAGEKEQLTAVKEEQDVETLMTADQPEKRSGEAAALLSHADKQEEQPPHHEEANKETQHQQQQQHRQLRTLDNMDDYPLSSACGARNKDNNEESVTLVVQTSPDRLWILHETCRRWSAHPIVVVVAVHNETDNPDNVAGVGGASSNTTATTTTSITQVRSACPNLDLVVHRLDDHPDDVSSSSSSSSPPYPVNRLRNLGLDRVRTSHVLVADVDFVPSMRLDETIVRYVQQQRQDHGGDRDRDRHALVVPAFERVLDPPCATDADCRRHLDSEASFLPGTFDELRRCVNERNECIVFQNDNNWEGHSSTGSKQWLERVFFEPRGDDEEPKISTPRQLHCFDSLRYEPYVVVRWCPSPSSAAAATADTTANNNNTTTTTTTLQRPVAPYYDERFHGYGKNKIQWIAHLRLLGYKFFVLPEGFIVHNPHVPSSAKREWDNLYQSTLHHDMDRLYESFLKELVEKYYETHRDEVVVQCQRHQQPQRQPATPTRR